MEKSLLLILILLVCCSAPMSAIKIEAQEVCVARVYPSENIFYTNTTSVGATFTISIIIENVPEPGFYGWEFILSWTPGVINCTEEVINYDLWGGNYLGPWFWDPIDNEAGQYHQSLSGKSPGEPEVGTFWLVNLTFVIVKEPSPGHVIETELIISPPAGSNYIIGDIEANEIPHEYEHGVYRYVSSISLPEATLEVVPHSIINPSLVPCEEFNVSIVVSEATNLHGFSLKVGYNASTIECVAVEEGDFLSNFGETEMAYLIDNYEGFVWVSINLTSPEAVAEGDGTLFKLTFHVLSIWESVLDIYDVSLYDAAGFSLPYNAVDGYFNNILMPKLYIDPPTLIDPSMKPGDQFQLNVNVANVSDLYDFEFKLTYDTNVLNGLGIIVVPINNETSFNVEFKLNDTVGEIWVKVQYYPPAEPAAVAEPTTLVKLFFQVQFYGSTYIHFNESRLSNSLGMSITHIAEDGYVSVLRRDIAVLEITPEMYEVYKGWEINITVTVKNLGDIEETFEVILYCNDNEINRKTVVLASNTSLTVVFQFDTNQAWIEPCHNYTISAEVTEVPFEMNITNNYLEDGQIHIKLMGDINGDKIVNYTDAILIGAAFGSKPGDPNWNPNADLNKDGYVNYKDVIVLGRNFGAVCP